MYRTKEGRMTEKDKRPEAIKLYQAGASGHAVLLATGASWYQLRGWLLAAGVPIRDRGPGGGKPRGRVLTPADRRRIRNLRTQGRRLREIAGALNCSVSTVCQALKRETP